MECAFAVLSELVEQVLMLFCKNLVSLVLVFVLDLFIEDGSCLLEVSLPNCSQHSFEAIFKKLFIFLAFAT